MSEGESGTAGAAATASRCPFLHRPRPRPLAVVLFIHLSVPPRTSTSDELCVRVQQQHAAASSPPSRPADERQDAEPRLPVGHEGLTVTVCVLCALD
eukprot:4471411-Prymnesium_polylepis.1